MYVRLFHFKTSGDRKAEVRKIADSVLPKIKEQKGCWDCMFIMHESDNEYAMVVYWETVEQADAAADIIGPLLVPAVNRISTEPVFPALYEVYRHN